MLFIEQCVSLLLFSFVQCFKAFCCTRVKGLAGISVLYDRASIAVETFLCYVAAFHILSFAITDKTELTIGH